MNKFVRAATTSQSLSLAAMEEASRLGRREADIEHLFLALVISDQSAGHALRDMGIDLDTARRAVERQHEAQLSSLGIEATFPDAGRIVFHETSGYEWSTRAQDTLARSAGKGKEGDAAAVLRELLAEPSGLIADILHRLGVTPHAVLSQLDRTHSAVPRIKPPRVAGRGSGSTEVFISAPKEAIWDLLADPARIPVWESSIGVVEDRGQQVMPGAEWEGRAPTVYPDGRPAKIKPPFRRRRLELVVARHPHEIVWSLGFPDVPRSNPVLAEFRLATVTGGTQVQITRSWARRRGWRRIVMIPLRPVQRFVVWVSLFQTGSALSRAFR